MTDAVYYFDWNGKIKNIYVMWEVYTIMDLTNMFYLILCKLILCLDNIFYQLFYICKLKFEPATTDNQRNAFISQCIIEIWYKGYVC